MWTGQPVSIRRVAEEMRARRPRSSRRVMRYGSSRIFAGERARSRSSMELLPHLLAHRVPHQHLASCRSPGRSAPARRSGFPGADRGRCARGEEEREPSAHRRADDDLPARRSCARTPPRPLPASARSSRPRTGRPTGRGPNSRSASRRGRGRRRSRRARRLGAGHVRAEAAEPEQTRARRRSASGPRFRALRRRSDRYAYGTLAGHCSNPRSHRRSAVAYIVERRLESPTLVGIG